MIKNKNQYINREISWLRFNERVLQESADKNVPLIERFRFAGIFSNNLDEFFKVRYATVKRIVEAGKKGKSVLGGEVAKDLLEEITKVVIAQQSRSIAIILEIEEELEAQNIFLLTEKDLSKGQQEFVKKYFLQNVRQAQSSQKERLGLPALLCTRCTVRSLFWASFPRL